MNIMKQNNTINIPITFPTIIFSLDKYKPLILENQINNGFFQEEGGWGEKSTVSAINSINDITITKVIA